MKEQQDSPSATHTRNRKRRAQHRRCEGVSDRSPQGRDAAGGSMRSTRARSGIAGDARNRGTPEAHMLKSVDPPSRLPTSSSTRRTAQTRSRLYGKTRTRNCAFAVIRICVNKTTRKHDKARETSRAVVRWMEKGKRPAEAGRRATLSRPCCVTRSGCARRPRLRPDGHRWSPGTMGHPASPTGRAGPPC